MNKKRSRSPRTATVTPTAEGADKPTTADDVEVELPAREPIFHRPELGTTRDAYLALTAEDFWEVGASGRVYDRGPTLRVTLWRRDEDGCKIVYHQRTLIQDA